LKEGVRATGTAMWTGTYRGTGTATGTKTLTGTLTGTTTVTGTLTITATGTKTNTATKTVTKTAVGTGTKTVTQTYTAIPTVTATSTATTTGTNTATVTKTATMTATATATSLTSVPNPCYGTWAFCDNFETGNGSGWNVKQGPVQNFSVVPDGSQVYRESDPTASQLYISQAQAGMAWLNSTVEANLKPLSFSSSSALVTLWGRYDATWNADCGYYVGLRGDGKVVLGKRVVGVSSAIGSAVAVPGGINPGTWYDVKLDMQGTTLKAYVNGTQLLTQTDSSCTSGMVGVGSVGASFEADDVRVTAPTTNTCVQNWRDPTNQCGAFCTYEATVQSDRAGCGAFLDCYANNGCSPETCGGQDDVCGVNRPNLNTWGTASKEVADQVYKCLGCAGSVNCANPKYYNGTVCADGNPCTWGDTCQNKVCVPDPNRATQCAAADQCHGVGTCSTATGICDNPTKQDGTACDDSNGCTQTDTCLAGVCKGSNPKSCPSPDLCHVGFCNSSTGECEGTLPVTCTPSDSCHKAGECDLDTGTCSNPPIDKIGCNIFLSAGGVADMGGGNYIAIFGWDNQGTSNFHPAQNEVRIDGELQSPQEAQPPYSLQPGLHPGGYLASFNSGQTITWTVDGVPNTLTKAAPLLTPVTIGTGKGVTIGGATVMLKPDLSPYQAAPTDPGQSDPPSWTSGTDFNATLNGQLTVGPVGQAIYTVPIGIPPGIAGMAPNLSLVYDSQGPDGIAGQGWNLAGLSMIYRCPKTLAKDGYSRPVELDTASVSSDDGDGVCLDGDRLYFRSTGFGTSTFESEIKDFGTITRTSTAADIDYFVVTTKSGEKRFYGSNGKSRVDLPASGTDGSVQTVPAIWPLDKVTDVWGNYFEIHYNNDTPSAVGFDGLLVTQIKYTGHDGATPDEGTPPFYNIDFTYDPDGSDGGRYTRSQLEVARFCSTSECRWNFAGYRLCGYQRRWPAGFDYGQQVDQWEASGVAESAYSGRRRLVVRRQPFRRCDLQCIE
jgi:hypothetical protein